MSNTTLNNLNGQENRFPNVHRDQVFPSQIVQHHLDRSMSLITIDERMSHHSSLIQMHNPAELMRKTMLRIKVNQICNNFIYKLKRNAGILKAQNYVSKQKIITLQSLIVLYQKIQDFVIILHFSALILVFMLTSFTATINKFDYQQSTHFGAVIVKIVCLALLITQYLVNLASRFGRFGTSVQLNLQNFIEFVIHHNSIINLINILFIVLFIILPTNQIFAYIYFTFLSCILLVGISENSTLQADYVQTKRLSFIWKLGKIFITNLIIIHITATILLAMAHLDPEQSWLSMHNVTEQNSDWQYFYYAGFYWSTIIVTTVGFGDYIPHTQKQQLIVAFLAMVSCIVLAFNISEFSSVFSQLRKSYSVTNDKMISFRRLLRRDINNNVFLQPKLKRKIKKYIETRNSDSLQLTFIQKNQFLAQLPKNLKKQYYAATNKSLFSKTKFLSQLRHQTLTLLYEKFTITFLEPEQTLELSPGQISTLQQGDIMLTYEREGSLVNGHGFDRIVVGKRQNLRFLTSDFLTLHQQHNYGLISKTYSVIWGIKIQDFIEILRNDVIDFQYYFSILHKHSIDDDQWQIVQCKHCSTHQNKRMHTAFRCPQLSYLPYRKIIILRHIYSQGFSHQQKLYVRHKTTPSRVSVLKYWRNYLQKNYEMQKKIDERQHLNNIKKMPKVKLVSFTKANRIYQSKQRQQIVEQQRNLNVEVDVPFNFYYYMPKFNPQCLIFSEVFKLPNDEVNSAMGTLKNIIHIKGHKFKFDDAQQAESQFE